MPLTSLKQGLDFGIPLSNFAAVLSYSFVIIPDLKKIGATGRIQTSDQSGRSRWLYSLSYSRNIKSILCVGFIVNNSYHFGIERGENAFPYLYFLLCKLEFDCDSLGTKSINFQECCCHCSRLYAQVPMLWLFRSIQ